MYKWKTKRHFSQEYILNINLSLIKIKHHYAMKQQSLKDKNRTVYVSRLYASNMSILVIKSNKYSSLMQSHTPKYFCRIRTYFCSTIYTLLCSTCFFRCVLTWNLSNISNHIMYEWGLSSSTGLASIHLYKSVP